MENVQTMPQEYFCELSSAIYSLYNYFDDNNVGHSDVTDPRLALRDKPTMMAVASGVVQPCGEQTVIYTVSQVKHVGSVDG